MENVSIHPALSNFTRIDSNVWRNVALVAENEVAFDIRAYDFDDNKVSRVLAFFRSIKEAEPQYRQLIVEDIISTDEWANWCGLSQPAEKALIESMRLCWVIASDAPGCDYNFILNYETPLFEGFEVGGWFDFDGKFKFAEIE